MRKWLARKFLQTGLRLDLGEALLLSYILAKVVSEAKAPRKRGRPVGSKDKAPRKRKGTAA